MHQEGICSTCWSHPTRKVGMKWVQTLVSWVPLICISRVPLALQTPLSWFFCWALLSCPPFLVGGSTVLRTQFSSHHILSLSLVFCLFLDLSNYYVYSTNIPIYIFALKPFLKSALDIDEPGTLHKHLI